MAITKGSNPTPLRSGSHYGGLSKSGSAKAIFCDRNHGRSPADAPYRGPRVIVAIEIEEKSMITLRNKVIAVAGLVVLALPSTALA
jgi:hypothetical protein